MVYQPYPTLCHSHRRRERGYVDAVKFAATYYDPDILWQDEAYSKLVQVPRVFLGKVASGIIDAAKAEGISKISPEFLDRVRSKRSEDED